MTQKGEHRKIWRRLTVRQTTPTQIRQAAPAQAVLELYKQARLAKARCTDYAHHLAVAGLDLGK
jgi:hypothetical protein